MIRESDYFDADIAPRLSKNSSSTASANNSRLSRAVTLSAYEATAVFEAVIANNDRFALNTGRL